MKKWLILSLFFALMLISSYYSLRKLKTESSPYSFPFSHELEKLYYLNSSRGMNDFTLVVRRPLIPSSRNVFFVETSCAFKPSLNPGYLHLTKRQACAVYSTALLNPQHQIIILHTCPLVEDYFQRWEEDWPELLTLANVGIIQAEISMIISNTPVEKLLDGRLNHSTYPVEHSSDVIRLAILYKYGGTYIDTDVITIRPLDELGSDYIAAQDAQILANGIMNFNPSGVGHRFLERTLLVLQDSYEGSTWSGNGPELITSQLRKFCELDSKQKLNKLGKLDCGLTIHPESFFFPVPYWDWNLYLENNTWPSVKPRLKNSYIVHFWNKLSKNTTVHRGSMQPYGLLADKYCSPIYSKGGDVF